MVHAGKFSSMLERGTRRKGFLFYVVWGGVFAFIPSSTPFSIVHLFCGQESAAHSTCLILLPLVFFTMGLAWVLAALGVYLRDIGQMTGAFTTILMFLSPVFYSADRLPENFKTAMYLNPLTFIIEQARDVLMWGKLPNWNGLGLSMVISLLVC